MNFPTEVVTPKEIAHYLLFTRWHHFWGQIRTWDKSEKNQAEAELADALESYAESFRAETLAGAGKHMPWDDGKCSCGARWRPVEGFGMDTHAGFDGGYQKKTYAAWEAHIRSFSQDPNWLDRQLEEVRAETLARVAELEKALRDLLASCPEECHCAACMNAAHVLNASDPNWLARQIAQAQIEEHGEQCDCTYENGEFHPCPRREELDRAISATKLESGK